MPTRTITVAEDAVDVVVEALRREAARRQRVATTLAGELELERAGGRDIRSGAVRVTRILVEAGQLEAVATELEGTPLTDDQPGDPLVEAWRSAGLAAPPSPAALLEELRARAAGGLEDLRPGAEPGPIEPGHLATGRPGRTAATVRPAGDPPTEDDVAEALAAIDADTAAAR